LTHSIAIRSSLSRPRPRPFGTERRRDAAVATASDLKHIFLIAGPSGSGKSTFMREFMFDRLPKDVSDALPDDAKVWQRTSGNELSRKGLERIRTSRARTAGLVVHYDIMRPFSRRFELFSNDPAIKELTASGAALTVLTIAPSREALLEQFLKRAADRDYVEWWDRRRWTRELKRNLREAFYKLTGKKPKLLKEEQLRLLGLYASNNGLKRWLAHWESFLDGVASDLGNVRLVFVSPEGLRADHPRFRLLRRG
jgi:hypothetical protein